MSGSECACFPVPERYHHVHYGATEPGSAWEWNPDCPQHPGDPLSGPAVSTQGAHHV